MLGTTAARCPPGDCPGKSEYWGLVALQFSGAASVEQSGEPDIQSRVLAVPALGWQVIKRVWLHLITARPQ